MKHLSLNSLLFYASVLAIVAVINLGDRFVKSENRIEIKPNVAYASDEVPGEQVPTETASPTASPTPTARVEKAVVATSTPRPVEHVDKTIQEQIEEVFGQEASLALAIFRCESGLNPKALKSDNIEHSVGIAQINIASHRGRGKKVHWAKVPGETVEEKTAWLMESSNNIKTAKRIQSKSGWGAWSTFKNGCYKKYL
jgi:hypothetical protein